MSEIHVCPLSQVASVAANSGATHMVTLLSDAQQVARPKSVPADKHLVLTFNDIAVETKGFVLPGERDVRRLIDYAKAWNRDEAMLIHCWMGVSRSTAAAYIVAATLMPEADEHDLAQMLRSVSSTATPNAMMIEIADYLLERDGRMAHAIDAIGRGEEAYEGIPFMLQILNKTVGV